MSLVYVYTSCFLNTVLTIFFYHFGCYIVFKLKLWDGARVFPVHGVWLVTMAMNMLYVMHILVQWLLGRDVCWNIQSELSD